MLSASGMFEKDCNSTQGFDAEPQLAESSFDYVQAMDEFDLEQTCLLRLKTQREKIEELTRLYQDNEQELARREQQEKEMREKMEELEEMAAFKQEWTDLKREYEALARRNQITEEELADLKRSLEELTCAAGDESENLRQEIKYLKEERLLSDAHWEAIISDKEELIKKDARTSQEKEYSLCEKISQLEEQIETLEEELAEKNTEIEGRKDDYRCEITAKSEDLVGFEKILDSLKKQNSDLKTKIVSLQDSYAKEKQQFVEAIEQLRMQVKFLRKDQAGKENEIYEFKEMIKKCDSKNQSLESTVTTLKTNLKKFKVNTDTSIKKVTSTSEEERLKQDLFIHELKTELERQMEEKGALAGEIRRLKGQLERKEQQEKQRKLLLMTEFREIDKMEKVVKKII